MTTRRHFRLVLLATAIHAAIAGLAASPLFFVPNVATAQRVFGGSNGEANLFEDVRAYHEYASRTLGGEIPYRDFVVEYPIGALPLFLAPRWVAAGPIAYRWAFAAEMLMCDAAIVYWVARRGERTIGAGRAVLWYSLCLGSLGALPIARFDLAAALTAFAAALAWESGRSGIGGVLAGLGGLTKLFPLVVAGPGLVRGRLRGGVHVGLTIAIGASIWVAIGGAGVGRSLRYHAGRGLEIESLYAGVVMIVAKAAGWVMRADFNHSSVELIAPGARGAAALAPILQLASLAWIIGTMFRRERRPRVPRVVLDPCSGDRGEHCTSTTRGTRDGHSETNSPSTNDGVVNAAGACVLAFALFGKVLSPQYILWILPFVATLDGRPGRWARPLLLVAGVLTTLVYFWAGVGLLNFHPLAIAILNARNLLLIAIFALMVRAVDA